MYERSRGEGQVALSWRWSAQLSHVHVRPLGRAVHSGKALPQALHAVPSLHGSLDCLSSLADLAGEAVLMPGATPLPCLLVLSRSLSALPV